MSEGVPTSQARPFLGRSLVKFGVNIRITYLTAVRSMMQKTATMGERARHLDLCGLLAGWLGRRAHHLEGF